MSVALVELLELMSRLRGPNGCCWDRKQTYQSIAPYTIEEAYEVADAIMRQDLVALKDELGDLLLQVVFHAQIAEEAGEFDFEAVARGIGDKLIRRHPHVFDSTIPISATSQTRTWEEIKARERAARQPVGSPVSDLDGVALGLPALMRAYKISQRAARVGFDFDKAQQAADKVTEELLEIRLAMQISESSPKIDNVQNEAHSAVFEEVGDLLFAAANLARKLDVDAESALHAATQKFQRRFSAMEALAIQRGEVFSQLNLAAQENLWREVKRAENK